MEERRTAPRWPFNTSVLYQILGEDRKLSSVLLEDINLVGARANFKSEVVVHSRLKLVIEVPHQPAPIFTEGEVIWQNREGARLPTGIRFTVFKPADKQRILNFFTREIRHDWWKE